MRISSGRLIRADKNGDEKDGPGSFCRTRRLIPAISPPLLVLPIESYLNGSYALIDPFLAFFLSRPKYYANDVYRGRS